jgi:N-acetylglucosamine malate deacetylase 1
MGSLLKRWSRRAAQRSVGVALRFRAGSRLDQPGGCLLVVAPHQDDETLGCGALIRRATGRGERVHVVFVTDGSAGLRHHPRVAPADLARRRRAEAAAALATLGVTADWIHFMDAPDGHLAGLEAGRAADLTARLAGKMAEIRPDRIFVPCRDDGSTEHEAAFHLVSRARDRAAAAAQLWEFPVWSWWRPWRLLGRLRSGSVARVGFPGAGAVKAAALDLYASQFRAVEPWTEPVLDRDFLRSFCLDHEFFFARSGPPR